jgi:acetyl-CoA acetyltransferase
VAQIDDGFSASVIYGLESYGFRKEGEALDFIQDGRIELDGELLLNTFGGSLGTGRIHGCGTSSRARCWPRGGRGRGM